MAEFGKGRMDVVKLLFIALLAIATIIAADFTRELQKDPLFDYKLAAANLMERSMSVIKEAKVQKGIRIERETDPNGTGLIGEEYTDITTSLGSLSSKRTSTNPNFAGVIVEMLFRAGVKMGDRAAISLSGSFPALNIAVLCSARVLKLKPSIISSVGASTYGANDPQLTWLDMESLLRENGIIPYVSEAASLGGIVAIEEGIGGKGVDMGLEAINRNAVSYLDEQGEKTLERDIKRRLAIYEQVLGFEKPAVFINVGGSLVSLGNCPEAYALSSGLLLKPPVSKDPARGLIFRMSEMGIPVIHLLNIKKIATQYGLPIDPIPLPPVPSGRVMSPRKYSPLVAFVGLILLCLTIAVFGTKGFKKALIHK
jgi:poly-gamma-glutamate system protein